MSWTPESLRDDLRERLGRDPTPMERVTEAQRRRHEMGYSRVPAGGTFLEVVKQGVRDRADVGLPHEMIVRHLERSRGNHRLPAAVSDGLPMDEEGIEAVYTEVLEDVEAGELP